MQIHERGGAGVAECEQEDFRNPWLLEDVFADLIEGLKRPRLVFDLSRVESTASLGVAVLVATQGLALIHGTSVAFAGVRPAVRRLIELSGAGHLLAMHETVDEALDRLDNQPKNGTDG